MTAEAELLTHGAATRLGARIIVRSAAMGMRTAMRGSYGNEGSKFVQPRETGTMVVNHTGAGQLIVAYSLTET